MSNQEGMVVRLTPPEILFQLTLPYEGLKGKMCISSFWLQLTIHELKTREYQL